MTEFANESQKSKYIAKFLLRVSSFQVIIYVLVSVSLIGMAFWKNETEKVPQFGSATHDSYSQVINWVNGHIPLVHASRLSLYVIWAIIGIIIYMAGWLVLNAYTNLRIDTIASSSSFAHPETFDRQKYWRQIVARQFLRIVSIVALVIYVIVWLRVIAPALITAFEHCINSFFSITCVVYFVLFWAGAFLSLHAIGVLLRLVQQKFLNKAW